MKSFSTYTYTEMFSTLQSTHTGTQAETIHLHYALHPIKIYELFSNCCAIAVENCICVRTADKGAAHLPPTNNDGCSNNRKKFGR